MVTIADFDPNRYAATDQVRCITVFVPDDDSYLPLLAGLLSLPGYQSNYQDPESAQAEGVAAVWRDAYVLTDWEGCAVQGVQNNITLLHAFAQVVNGNALQLVLDTAQTYATYHRQNTAANADRTRYWMNLTPGDYQLKMLHLKTPTNGIIDLYLFGYPDPADDVIIATGIDLYNAATLRNQLYEVNFTVVTPGNYHLDLVVTGKNASSSSFHVPITALYIQPQP